MKHPLPPRIFIAVLALLAPACQQSNPSSQPTAAHAGRPFNAQTGQFEDPKYPAHRTSPGDAAR